MSYSQQHVIAEGETPASSSYANAEFAYIYSSLNTEAAAIAAHIADTSDAHDASAISVADAGDLLTATTVEGALAELHADVTNHTGDTSAAHAASAISIADSGEIITATDVEGALAELAAKSSDVVNDTTPQLGGDLDVNGKKITSASNGDVVLEPNGSGKVDVVKKTLFEKQVYFAEVDDTAAGAAVTLDWTAGLKHKFTLSEAVTFTFTAPTGPTNLVLRVIQHASAAKAITWPSTVKWVYTPTYTGLSKTYVFTFYYDGTNYLGSMVGPYTE